METNLEINLQQLIKIKQLKEQRLRIQMCKLENEITQIKIQLSDTDDELTQKEQEAEQFKKNLYTNKYTGIITSQEVFDAKFTMDKLRKQKLVLEDDREKTFEQLSLRTQDQHKLQHEIATCIVQVEKYRLIGESLYQ